MSASKLVATRLVTTPTGDVQKLDAVSGEVLSTIPSNRLKVIQKATDSANLHERAIKYGDDKHGPEGLDVAHRAATGHATYKHIPQSSVLMRGSRSTGKPRINWIDDLLVAVLCLTIAAIIVVH
jgi:hypothetical protein